MTGPTTPAARPAARTVSIEIPAGQPFAGWRATAAADFPAGRLADLQSGRIDRILETLEAIILEHNFPNLDDELAATLADVAPYDGLLVVAAAIFEAIAKLPNR